MTLTAETTSLDQRLRERDRPAGRPVMYQRWEELLFLHWAVDPEAVADALPPALRLDTFEGRAWVGVVPFFMRGVRPRGLPAVPGLSSFQELNLRTYAVDRDGRPGVWFFSLDAADRIAVWIARKFFHLNYRLARMGGSRSGGAVRFSSRRAINGGWDAAQEFRWHRTGPARQAAPGTLEFFLVERYRLFTWEAKRGRLHTGKIHHAPYRLEQAEVEAFSPRLFDLNGLQAPAAPPDSVLAAASVPVEIFPLRRAATSFSR